jgi:biotin transport system substrate-specific component
MEILMELTAAREQSNRHVIVGAAKVMLAVAAIALSAKTMIPLPSTPVPVSAQTLAVLLAGALLGSELGLASVATYLAIGLAGLPVFTMGGGPACLLGPTGGYLLGFMPAAWIAGRLAGGRLSSRLAGLVLADAAIFAFGLVWLGLYVPAGKLLWAGLAPFLPGEALKLLLAAMVLRALQRQAH